jgi:predicted GNAT family acetyltransferase
MQIFSKTYNEDDDGFDGNIEAYYVSTQKENLKNWLSKEVSDSGLLYQTIQKITNNILIIKNINIEEQFRGQGFGSQIITEIINKSFAEAAILMCDISEEQLPNFVLEKFYESNDFNTIFRYLDYPLMMYPSELGDKVTEKLKMVN